MQERRFATTAKVADMIAATKINELASPDGAVNFNQQQVTSMVIENRTSEPDTPVDGQIWLRTDL